jgi:hypothetical protein
VLAEEAMHLRPFCEWGVTPGHFVRRGLFLITFAYWLLWILLFSTTGRDLPYGKHMHRNRNSSKKKRKERKKKKSIYKEDLKLLINKKISEIYHEYSIKYWIEQRFT